MTDPRGIDPCDRSFELGPPTYDDFDVLKHAMLAVGEEPDARVIGIDPWRIGIILERTFVDMDTMRWPPLIVRFSGILAIKSARTKMVIRYRELSGHDKTMNSSVNHDYILAAQGHQVIEYGHTMRACPDIRRPRIELPATDEMLDQTTEGEKILRANTGNQLELSAGDCGVLYDRLLGLLA